MDRLRIALLTPEFPTESGCGGTGHATARIAAALHAAGHDVEVLIFSGRQPVELQYLGVPVLRSGATASVGLRLTTWLRRPWDWVHGLALGGRPRPALLLADLLRARHREAAFHAVISMSLQASGLLVPPLPGCIHVVRITATERQLRGERESGWSMGFELEMALHRRVLRHAEVLVAPCRATAESVEQALGRAVQVIRTPIQRDAPIGVGEIPAEAKYLLHFGRLCRSKGSDDVAAALALAWEWEPELRMLWAGREASPGVFARCARHWRKDEQRVRWLGPVDPSMMRAVLSRAVAAVLPSHVDNLPNTAIESLVLAVPVIGTIGSSVDELVEDGRSGELVGIRDVKALAAAMVRMWQGESACQRAGFVPPAVLEEMEPGAVAARWLALIEEARRTRGDSRVRASRR